MPEPWSSDKTNVVKALNSDFQNGLTTQEASVRLKKHGPNRLTKERSLTFWSVFREEVTEPMILLLLVVGVVYAIWGEARDAITIFAVIIALVLTEIFTEYRAKKAVAALRKLSPTVAALIRDGLFQKVPVPEIVSGDILVLEGGDRVPADARILESFSLEVDESSLTGESLPVTKEDAVLPAATPLADRKNMLFAGTTVTRGRGRVIVTATGMDTELGRITGLVIEAKPPKTPLQLAMKQLAGILVWVAVFFSAAIPLAGILQGKDWQQMVLTGLSLSFATIPEELPIIVTMVLGVGAFTLSRQNVLVRKLKAAETLGSVTVIATDKTGTLTENRMSIAAIATDGNQVSFNCKNLSAIDKLLLEVGAVTAHVRKGPQGLVGDPMDVALFQAAQAAGMQPQVEGSHLLQEFGFDSRRKMMSAVVQKSGETLVYAKGAPEAILERSMRVSRDSDVKPKTAQDTQSLLSVANNMAGEAMRVIGFAYKKLDSAASLTQDEVENNLVFIGFAGLSDPPRKDVKEALKTTADGGVRTIVVSGDHPLTVQKIAAQAGINSDNTVITGAELEQLSSQELKNRLRTVSLFARTSPEQKLRIVHALQEQGEVVAVTGDGINDAPALKNADIGVAMGETGTEVAREAADMILTDDSFNSIAAGVREGRKIYDNLKKGVSYYLSVKIALILTFVVPLLLGIPFPFAPIQIILLELFMDLAASATFVAEPIEPDVMRRLPLRRRHKFIDNTTLVNIVWGSVSLAAAVLASYLFTWYSGWDAVLAQTTAFATWMVGHILLAFTMRSQRESLLRIGLFSNRIMLIWAGATLLFLIAITGFPLTREALKVAPFTAAAGWLMAVGAPLLTIFWFELRKAFLRRAAKART